jgi:hypothetical protein
VSTYRNYTHLHWFRCSFCKSYATHPILLKGHYQCAACRRLLAFIESVPITTDRQRERAEGGLVFSTLVPEGSPVVRYRHCSVNGCDRYEPEAEMIRLPGIGWFCSPEHVAQGQVEWDAFMDRIRNLKQEMPWLYQE